MLISFREKNIRTHTHVKHFEYMTQKLITKSVLIKLKLGVDDAPVDNTFWPIKLSL